MTHSRRIWPIALVLGLAGVGGWLARIPTESHLSGVVPTLRAEAGQALPSSAPIDSPANSGLDAGISPATAEEFTPVTDPASRPHATPTVTSMPVMEPEPTLRPAASDLASASRPDLNPVASRSETGDATSDQASTPRAIMPRQRDGVADILTAAAGGGILLEPSDMVNGTYVLRGPQDGGPCDLVINPVGDNAVMVNGRPLESGQKIHLVDRVEIRSDGAVSVRIIPPTNENRPDGRG